MYWIQKFDSIVIENVFNATAKFKRDQIQQSSIYLYLYILWPCSYFSTEFLKFIIVGKLLTSSRRYNKKIMENFSGDGWFMYKTYLHILSVNYNCCNNKKYSTKTFPNVFTDSFYQPTDFFYWNWKIKEMNSRRNALLFHF